MTDFELQCKQIKDEGRCLMEYIRGSHLYNLNTPESDLDTGGIYIATDAEVLGMLNYKPQISDEKHDNTWYEIGNFIELLMKSNPTVMEALFAPDNKIIGEVHPIIKELRDKRNLLLTKDCFNPFYGYAKSQIEKARGLNKKIVNPVKEKKGPLDFTYTFYNQGSTKIKNWLEYRGLDAKYCGLVNIPNMHEIYGLYYDFGNHILHEENWRNNEALLKYVITLINSDITYDNIDIIEPIEYGYAIEWLEKQEPIGYRGLIDFENETSFLRLSSVPDKHAKPICHISYNMDGYKKHCKEYKEYKEWEKMRNPVRYESNLNKTYDSKNLCHCFRLMHMAKEILRDGEFNLERTWDHDFLMDVRNHKFEYEELIDKLEQEKKEMEEIYQNSKLPEHIDPNALNEILINIRKMQLNIK